MDIRSGMNLSNWKRLDPHLLVGLVNTELRNQSESLEDFLKTYDISGSELREYLSNSGYEYRQEQKQFR